MEQSPFISDNSGYVEFTRYFDLFAATVFSRMRWLKLKQFFASQPAHFKRVGSNLRKRKSLRCQIFSAQYTRSFGR
jgi:hypothetical protein